MARAVIAPLLQLPLQGARVSVVPSTDDNTATILRRTDEAPLGTLVLERPEPGVLFVKRLCIEDPHRSYGAGSEAARLVIDAATRASYHLLRAWAPPDLGLAVYFWFRMGLRPLHGHGPNGGIWLVREL